MNSTEGKDEDGNEIKKIYFLSKHLKASWAEVGGICNAYGMEFVSLETLNESEKFLQSCTEKYQEFDDHVHVGAISHDGNSKNGFYWMNSGKRINYPLEFGRGEPNNYGGKEFCLSIQKQDTDVFLYNDINCSDSFNQFICQKSLK